MKIVIITGQTAAGKTKLAINLARKYNGELVNCDSRQIYKYLDVITGKDLDKETKIWLYDAVNPKQYFSSYDYQQLVIKVIKKLLKKNITPIIVGGTYFYLYHLLHGVETEDIPPDFKLRKKLENKSITQLQILLKKLSFQSFNRLNQSDKSNPRRLMRKIEIFNYLRKNQALEPPRLKRLRNANWRKPRRLNEFLAKKLDMKNLDIEFIGLKFKDKNDLIQAIKSRVEERIKMGAIEEVKNLLKKGYTENDPGLKTIGYQQIIQHLKGNLSKKEAINQWVSKEIQYAKRQYTFMKKDPNIKWQVIYNTNDANLYANATNNAN